MGFKKHPPTEFKPIGQLSKKQATREVAALREGIRRHDYLCAATRTIDYVLEPKFGGFFVEVVYGGGRFERGLTRGDGDVGEDISHNLKTVRAVPLALRRPREAPARLAVRGEVFMPDRGFQALNKARIERQEEPFANPRNAAAGVMRQLDSRKVAGLPLDAQNKNRDVLARMQRAGVRVRDMPERTKQPLAGQAFVLTGRLGHYTRVRAEERIEALGGRVSSSVSAETDYGVVGEGPGSKLDEVRRRRVKGLADREFRSLIGDA